MSGAGGTVQEGLGWRVKYFPLLTEDKLVTNVRQEGTKSDGCHHSPHSALQDLTRLNCFQESQSIGGNKV